VSGVVTSVMAASIYCFRFCQRCKINYLYFVGSWCPCFWLQRDHENRTPPVCCCTCSITESWCIEVGAGVFQLVKTPLQIYW